MTGYDFTRFDSDFTDKVKVQAYEASEVAMKAKRALNKDGKDYKDDPDYKDAKYWFIETTMTCVPEEARIWMEYYMTNAIAYGIKTKNLDWRTKFLAAWDIFETL